MSVEGDIRIDAFKMVTEVDGIGYVLEEIDNDGDIHHLIFIGTHDQLNLYQIWYNDENKLDTPLKVISSFAPVVRVKADERPAKRNVSTVTRIGGGSD